MSYSFKILDKKEIQKVVPLIEKLNNYRIEKEVLEERFHEMGMAQNYECAVVCDNDVIVGVSGIWYCTRHYSGRSAEVDHVYIDESLRGEGLGKQFFEWIYKYVEDKGYQVMELNTYVGNSGSHKFYFNEGFKIIGYHFIKKF